MISKFSVKKAYTVIVGIILVMILGAVAYTKMTVDLLPSMELPYAIVLTTYPGASPEAVETGVTRPIEQSVATIDNIENIQSISSENFSMVILEFNSDANMDTATIDMRENLDQVSSYFDDSVGNPIIMKLNPNMMPVMIAAVDKAGTDSIELSEYVEDTLSPAIEGLEGVASVTVMGAVEESVQVIIREDKLEKVNKQVKKALDDKFAEAEDALAEGKSQISSGKSQLKSGQAAANQQFAAAEVQINDAKYELLKSEQEINDALKELAAQDAELAKAEEQKPQIKKAISSLQELLKSYRALAAQKEQLEAAVAANPEDVASAAQLQAVTGAMQTMEQKLAEQQDQEGNPLTFDSLPAYIKSLQTSITQMEKGRTEIEQGKEQLNAALLQITDGKKSINDSYVQLKTKQGEADSQMAQAQAKLEQGESSLEEQEANFENAKEAAYEGADMESIITKSMISGILTAQNFDYPAGYITEDDVDYLVRVGEKFDDVDGLSGFVLLDLNMDGVAPVKLSDVADVFVANNADQFYTRINKNPGIVLSIAKQNEYSTKEVSDRVVERFEKISKEDDTVTFTSLMNQGMYIDLVSGSVLENLLFGAVLAILILLLFLKDIRPTGIIAVSIPVSVIFAIVLMYFSGVTLNVISLSGLALGVGMLVDNSIVVIENIYRLRKDGYSVKEASIKGASQMVGAITASTLTTVCVFLPIVFTSGITRQLFTDMGLTIAYSLFASLIVAVTFVPMAASKTFNRISEKENKLINRISEGYAAILPKVLNHKAVVFVLTLVLFVGSMGLSLSKGFSFIPEMDSTQMTMSLIMPEDTKTLQQTAEMSDKVIEKVLEIEDIKTVGALTGGSTMAMLGLGSDDSFNSVSYYIECKEDKTHTNEEIADMIREKTKDFDCEISVSASSMDMSALMTAGISIRVKGDEMDTLQDLAKQVGEKLKKVDGLTEVEDGLEDATPEYRLIVDKKRAAEYGLTVAQVYQKIQGALAEASSSTTLTTGTKEYPVYVKDEEEEQYTLKDVKNLTIEGSKGEEKVQVKVSKIADVEDAQSLSAISRINQVRYITVSAKVKEGYTTTAVSNEVKRVVDGISLPGGCQIEYDGENETVMEAMGQVMLMMLLAVAFMYLIMVAQFQSFKNPFIIMFTLPLAFTGGFAALFLTGNDVSVIAMIGMVMLAGIIVNNGIVFVDSVNQLMEEGMEMREAIVLTGKNRLRPITMTALTTILGLSTMAVGYGMGADMAQPMALVVVGGLIYGTLLTLIVVPCIYEAFNFRKRRRSAEEDIAVDEEEETDDGDEETVSGDEE
ncbi:MAG: efflux RND transporter permease subunit [Bacteroidales bacterium]|nr:efflux RND transporter permease subunit [Clostridium sp.]MCM1204142.1 efflux RND transporter permease subunit [Bacteroidales bacterium]